ncbi:MAG: hypothetical protein R2705_04300 [Ilumatobacteraceae bacterium]
MLISSGTSTTHSVVAPHAHAIAALACDTIAVRRPPSTRSSSSGPAAIALLLVAWATGGGGGGKIGQLLDRVVDAITSQI